MTIINETNVHRGRAKSKKLRCPIDGKVSYKDEEDAEKQLDIFKKSGNSFDENKLNVYMCVPTGYFHIGHKKRGCQ